jgi:putative ABC transport system permease protein
MKISNLVKIAWRSILLNKSRSLLTMLGIIIGVAAVIAMMAIGEGSKASIKEEISAMGTNVINIRPGSRMKGGIMGGPNTMRTLTIDDYKYLQKNARLITNTTPLVNANAQAIYASNNWPTSIYGVLEPYFAIRNLTLKEGSIFTQDDVDHYEKVVILGQTVVDNLFPDGESPLGKVVRFGKTPFTVIGVLEEKGENNFGQDQDDLIIAPFTTVQKRIVAQDFLQSIVASAISEDKAADAVSEIETILRERHNIQTGQEDDFNVFSMDELIDTFSSTSEMLTILLVAIAGISLFVGGIGIMNIMYVSVKERTKEIGLRMAVGARNTAILIQFLVEAVMISFTGGIIGILLGIAASYSVHSIMQWPVLITTSSILISFLVCALTGIFFGWYPARKAANLDPLEALRYE